MLLNNILWSFNDNHYPDMDTFNKDVIQYQKDIRETDEHWKPNEIVFGFPELKIQYFAWVTGPEELAENERLIEEDKDVFEKYPEEDEHQVEILADLKADNGKNFTTLELLMKIHNQMTSKYLGDHIFFEGLSESSEKIDGIPTFHIYCGS